MASRPNAGHAGRPRCASSTRSSTRAPLVHARYHDNGCGTPYGVKAERRARRQTALRLIDPVEYASAEALCEGDAYRIACELDVTLQVVNDYQDMLHDMARV